MEDYIPLRANQILSMIGIFFLKQVDKTYWLYFVNVQVHPYLKLVTVPIQYLKGIKGEEKDNLELKNVKKS